MTNDEIDLQKTTKKDNERSYTEILGVIQGDEPGFVEIYKDT